MLSRFRALNTCSLCHNHDKVQELPAGSKAGSSSGFKLWVKKAKTPNENLQHQVAFWNGSKHNWKPVGFFGSELLWTC